MKISVVYALPARQIVRELALVEGANAEEALQASGLLRDFPEIVMQNLKVGIHGKVVCRTTVLNNGDRVEIYRPLKLEPKEARRKRVGKE